LTACIRTPRYYTTYHEYKEPIVINESIDDVIDADERLSYELFHGIDNFGMRNLSEENILIKILLLMLEGVFIPKLSCSPRILLIILIMAIGELIGGVAGA